LCHFLGNFYELVSLGRGYPGKVQPPRFYTNMFQQILEQDKFPSGVIITFQVMTVSRVSPGNPDPIGAMAEGGQNKLRVHPCGTRDPDDPDIGRVLEATYACKISRTITAPVTEKSRNLWFPVIHILSSLQPRSQSRYSVSF
jgi:hypothetical protein